MTRRGGLDMKNKQLCIAVALLSLAVLHGCKDDSEETVDVDWKLAEYEVFRHESEQVGHSKARISIVRTQNNPPKYGLVFYQTNEKYRGGGLICDDAEQPGVEETSVFKCQQKMIFTEGEVAEEYFEQLAVGHISSKYCGTLRSEGKKASDKKNAVATVEECQRENPGNTEHCICYKISKCKSSQDCDAGDLTFAENEALDPPGNGSGTGGGNN